MKDSFIYYEYGLLSYQTWGIWRNAQYRKSKADFLRNTRFVSHCPICHVQLRTRGPKKNYTIDHIIPMWVIHEYGLFELEMNHRNWRVMCQKCNVERSQKEIDFESLELSSKVKDMLVARKLELAENLGS